MRPRHPKSKVRILEKAIPLFARAGFSGVSMRDIAKKVGVSAAALYYHFPDKRALYLQAMTQSFADKARALLDVLTTTGTSEERLSGFINRFCKVMQQDPDFLAFLQREMLDGDEIRMQMIAEQVFQEPFRAIEELSKELAPDFDPHMLAISMAGLVIFHLERKTLHLYLPGGRPEHNDPEVIAQHVTKLLLRGLKERDG